MPVSAAPLDALAPGTIVGRDFVIEGLARETRLGRLYTARSRSIAAAGERFEVRVPYTSSAGSTPAFREQMERIGRVAHRSVAPFVRCGVESVGPIVVTRALAPAETLRALLARGDALPLADVAGLVGEVAAALDAFHALSPPMVHRALSPDEIAVGGTDGAIAVGACGIVHALAASGWLDDHSEDFTDPWYLSPDALLEQVHPRMDTFVLASIAYECLTGTPAFPKAGDHAAILKGTHPSAADARPALASAVDAALARAWVPAAGAAYASSSAFAVDLALALRGAAPRKSRPSLRLAVAPDRSGVRATPATPPPPPGPRLPPAPTVSVAPMSTLDLDELWGDALTPPPPRTTAEWGVAPASPRPVSYTATTIGPPDPSTLSPPAAYPAWAGRVSRQNAAVEALSDGFGPPRAPAASASSDAAGPTAPPVTLPRRSVHAPRRPRPALADNRTTMLALAKIAARSALTLSLAIVAAATIVTGGRVYLNRSPRAAAARAIAAPVAAPVAAPAPAVAPAVQPVVAPAPAGPSSLAEMQALLMAAVSPCVAADHPEHHLRLHVSYAPDGHATRAAVGAGFFAVPPMGPCIERVAVTLALPPASRGTRFLDYVFVLPVRGPR
jgi:hypothetical protein